MLLVFRSAPYTTPRASPFNIHGFELEVTSPLPPHLSSSLSSHYLQPPPPPSTPPLSLSPLPLSRSTISPPSTPPQVSIDFVDSESERFSPRDRYTGFGVEGGRLKRGIRERGNMEP